MNFQFTRDLSAELRDVEGMFRESMLPWHKEMQTYIDLIELDHTWNIMPGIVFNIYRDMGLKLDFCISMTNIFKVVYLSIYIHELIKDDAEGQEYNQQMQFTILIGDYFFGRVVSLLIEAGADMLLPAFSDMIAEINEGMISHYKLGAGDEEFIQETRAPLYKTAFLTAARCSGKKAEEQELCKEAGYNLGMAAEFISRKACHRDAAVYLKQSERLLDCVPGIRVPSLLRTIVEEMHEVLPGKSNLAAV